ncbi:ABC transporter substrate-binding protein [Oceanobacillus oncorhynchi subsp. incaldanensis]|uniref:TRAP transporter substrate-binding protein n=1 Tax=Oceanobacillus oncorhynchi TaxID=545501 RepID=UPI001B18EE9C|nr:TRAP transporter substrate-binding protein [Oceanobacillus oncorhynchi]GIO20266.1 ABC transporter substrate-binding protein [Oceanobacillus oncorhynchi subsp. incaldanensis]
MKKIALNICVILIFLVLAACGDANGEGNVKLRIAHDSSASHPTNIALQEFAENVEERSEGEISIELFPASQIGNATEIMEQVRRGDAEMGLGASTHFTSLIPELAVWESFYLFDDAEHAHRVLDSEIGELTMEPLEDFNLTGLGYMEIGFRNFSNNKQPLETMEDFNGIKIRGYNPLQIKAWESLGVSLTNIAWDELFTSLSQNLIDGQESATTSFFDENFYEVQDYWSLTMHSYTNYLWYANQEFMNDLSDEHREIIEEEINNAIEHERELMDELEVETLEQLPDEGVEINEVPLEERHKMGEQMNEAIQKDIIEQTGQELYDQVMEGIEDYREE